jgi:hypothetical protein
MEECMSFDELRQQRRTGSKKLSVIRSRMKVIELKEKAPGEQVQAWDGAVLEELSRGIASELIGAACGEAKRAARVAEVDQVETLLSRQNMENEAQDAALSNVLSTQVTGNNVFFRNNISSSLLRTCKALWCWFFLYACSVLR